MVNVFSFCLYGPYNQKYYIGLKENIDMIDVRFIGDDYRFIDFTGRELNIPTHIISRDHGWSTTKFKKLISESYAKSNNS